MSRISLRLAIWTALVTMPFSASAQAPRTLAFQGILTNASGARITGSPSVTFRLYDAATGGSSVWSETKAVTAQSGLFSAVLGDATAFPSAFRFDRPLWLSLQVAGDPEAAPRLPLATVPYAMALYGLRTEANAGGPNIIGGGAGNAVNAGVLGATVAGGGAPDAVNQVTASFGTVGGGRGNQAGETGTAAGNATFATVAGGSGNTAAGSMSFVGGGKSNLSTGVAGTVAGGDNNQVLADYGYIGGGGPLNPADLTTRNKVTDPYGVIGGGSANQAGDDDPTTASSPYATVGGGRSNKATAITTTVAGGDSNAASMLGATVSGGMGNISSGLLSTIGGGILNVSNNIQSTVGGGGENHATGNYSTVAGGCTNVAGGFAATVGGGERNQVTVAEGTVAGGYGNTVSASAATVGGGQNNAASGFYATVAGGTGNVAQGATATVPGGQSNLASGEYSLAAGRNAQAIHQGAFVWGDSTNAPVASTAIDQFTIRATNGVRLTQDAGGSKAVGYGEHYRDNGLVAWALIAGDGSITQDYGVKACVKEAAGTYLLTLEATASGAQTLIPVAVPCVSGPPAGAANARLVSVSQNTANSFRVYVTDGTYALVDNDFTLMVTGR